ncbi:hypothetical protein [uncultured Tateyamaria sp.]|uniref:hypothetical protein n=1 Tax=uncultured Tateyamaria sp. TaxID=455651 RepID=UPI00261CE2FC|nr:hypothetical protein [uncultured Tateyamaria sp.]
MKSQCHACGEDIAENAKVCGQCNSSQNRFLHRVNSFANLGTLAVSLLALIVSFAALYFSTVKEPASPRLIVQVDRFNESEFSFFIANLGELPTLVRDFDLRISLKQGDGTHVVEAGFTVPPAQISPEGNRLFSVKYSSFVPRFTSWTATESTAEPFSLNFLYGAASLGGNLHCEVDVYFTSRRYFPSNIDGAEGSVNGTCSEAMKWFAENIGPLRLDTKSAK